MKKVFGYIMVAVAAGLALIALGTLPSLFRAFSGLIDLISGELDSYDSGMVIGWLIAWIIHLSLIVVLWVVGRKWIAKSKLD